jgi:lysine 2,3-aminomutase
MQNQNAGCVTEDVDDKPPPRSGACATCEVAEASAQNPDLPDWVISGQWNDWTWQMRNRIRTLPQLKKILRASPVSLGTAAAAAKFPLAITPYYASLIERFDGSDPVFRMCVPQVEELTDPPCLKDDPLEEDEDMPVPGLVHRYPDRALLISTTMCSAYCRHCTRKRVAGHRETRISSAQLRQAADYLRGHPEIHDVIISGGDPLTMATDALEKIISAVREVPTVDIIRIGSRVPVVMPMRITDELVAMLRKYHPIYINTHFNHPRELTPEAREACARMADVGIPLGNQTVLLRGVNDDPVVLEQLFRGCVRMRVRPYYLFQCDLVRGVEHFRTPISKGIEIMEYLRGRLSGLAIPTYVVDAPHGGGKIPILPNYTVSVSPTQTILRNYEGLMVAYPEPCDASAPAAVNGSRPTGAPGVWELSAGLQSKIQPAHMARQARRDARQSVTRAE